MLTKNMAYAMLTKRRSVKLYLALNWTSNIQIQLHIRNYYHNRTINNNGKLNLKNTRFVIMFIVILPAIWK